MFPVFDIGSESNFKELALTIFRYQFENNTCYRSFCDLLNVHHSDVTSIEQIPFLPIEFFKNHKVYTAENQAQQVFFSSGTTGTLRSQHQVADIAVYEQSFRLAFQQFYGAVDDYVILALLPSYLEQKGSSLVYMVADLIQKTKRDESGFFLDNHDALIRLLIQLNESNQKVLLIGVSYALLDLIEKHQFSLTNTVIMETGGMKGRRRELTREELHQRLKKGYGVQEIHSEYGMTELLSQAYSKGGGRFHCPPWMKVFIRDAEDPLSLVEQSRTGGINIVDLANYNSCSFIATQDLGKVFKDDSFEVLGRFDHSDIRGCNLLIS